MSMVVSLDEGPGLPPITSQEFSASRNGRRRAKLAAGILGSLALFPLVAVQGVLTRRRMPSLPQAQPPYRGFIAGAAPLSMTAGSKIGRLRFACRFVDNRTPSRGGG